MSSLDRILPFLQPIEDLLRDPAITEVMVNAVFDSMTDALAKGERIEIRGFGSFMVKQRTAREGRNPRTGEIVSVAAKRVPLFKVGKELRLRVDGQPLPEGFLDNDDETEADEE